MPKINVLDKSVAELIAAGEVVERPASIVKELVENSIDSGATDITVEIRGGGISFIRVADNGCGIEKEDIPRAFLRHATSKVKAADDLDGIHTLGFRGEALASIAAVSRVELTTKTEEEETGISYFIEGGEFAEESPAARPNGTTITVRDVFFNTPARMKFLKRDTGEGNAVAQVMDKCALSHPEIAFRFIRDGQVKLRSSGGGELLAVIRAVYGAEQAEGMLTVDYMFDGNIRVTGYISKPEASRPSRAYQNFFINSRYVRSRTCSAAIEEACKGKLMVGRYPACVLNVEIMANSVDVNVHPAKIEVRFADERPVFNSVYYAVKTALSRLDTPLTQKTPEKRQNAVNALTIDLPRGEYKQERITAREFRETFNSAGNKTALEEVRGTNETGAASFRSPLRMNASRIDIFVDSDTPPPKYSPVTPPFSDKKTLPGERTIASRSISGKNPVNDSICHIFNENAVNQPENDTVLQENFSTPDAPAILDSESPAEYRLIGELMNTYILLDGGDCLLLVDKHAAHERLVYEQILGNLKYGNRQVLLSPLPLTLPKEEYEALTASFDRLQEMGFLADDFGNGTVLVREVPIELDGSDIAGVVGEIAAKLSSGGRDITPDALDRLYYSIACKSAVRAGDKSNSAELEEIINKLSQNPQITHCPHGRPVSVRLSRNDIGKMFGRLG